MKNYNYRVESKFDWPRMIEIARGESSLNKFAWMIDSTPQQLYKLVKSHAHDVNSVIGVRIIKSYFNAIDPGLDVSIFDKIPQVSRDEKETPGQQPPGD